MRLAPSLAAAPDTFRDRFLALRQPRELAALLEVPYSTLVYLIYQSDKSGRYHQFVIPKRSGGSRAIMSPNNSLKLLQAKLGAILARVYQPKPSVHGYVAQRSVVTNAKQHSKRRLLLNLDLKDFFPTINFGRVRGLFMAKPYGLPKEVATVLAQICCHDNQLPQGAPSSPVVSNMVCARLDSQLQKLAKRFQCMYTRYADDITLSTFRSKFPVEICSREDGAVRLGDEMTKTISNNGFAINMAKVFLQGRDSHQQVTGLTVNVKPNVRRTYVREIRAMLHAWKRYGLELAAQHHFEHRYGRPMEKGDQLPPYAKILRGKIEYLAMVRGRDALYQKFTLQLDRLAGTIDPEAPMRVPAVSVPLAKKDDEIAAAIYGAMWVLECEEQCNQGTAFALKGYGLVTCHHVLCKHVKDGLMMVFRAEPDRMSKKYPISVVASHAIVDMAILKIEAPLDAELEIGPAQTGLIDRAKIWVGGFPNYSFGFTGSVMPGQVVGHRPRNSIRRAQVSAAIVKGASGGPVLNEYGYVVGIAVTGADSMEKADDTDKHGVVPIDAIRHLNFVPQDVAPVVQPKPPDAPTPEPPPDRRSSAPPPSS